MLVRIFLDDAKGIIMRVERSHEDEGDIDAARCVQMLNLPHGQIEESHVILDLQSTLGSSHAYKGYR